MSRPARIALLVLALLLLVIPPLALAADPLVPDRPDGAPAYGSAVPLYEDGRFSPYAYTFEGNAQFNSTGHVPIFFWMNQLMVTKAWLIRLALRMVEYALLQDFLTPFLNGATGALTVLRQFLWDGSSPLVAGALSLAGLWAIVLYMRGRAGRVWGALGGTTLVLVATALMVTDGPAWVTAANSLSRDVARQTYGAVDYMARDAQGWGLATRSGDALWRVLVYKPWLTGEFGTADGQRVYGQPAPGGFLTMDPEARYRICLEPNRGAMYCPWWQNEFLPQRMVIAGETFVAGFLVSGTLIALSGGIILAQIALLFLLALTPVWMMVAIWWPEQGTRILRIVLMRGLGALVMQVVLAATLAVLLLLTLAVTAGFGEGWMLQSLVLAGLATVAYRFRTAWLEPVRLATRRLPQEQQPVREEAMGGKAGARQVAVAAVGGAGASPELIPVFNGAFSFFSAAAPAMETGHREEGLAGAAGRHTVAEHPSGGPGTGLTSLFRSEMVVLRERMTLQEGAPGRSAHGDEPVPVLGPAARLAASRERVNDAARLPVQRPKA